jgi:hypothetical protein
MVHDPPTAGTDATRGKVPPRNPTESVIELKASTTIANLLRASPVPPSELLKNLSMYLRRETVGDMLVVSDLYREILDVPGVVIEFGVRWGRRMATLIALRELFEPYNFTRRVIGFDTFTGFPAVSAEDGPHPAVQPGSYAVPENYASYLDDLLGAHEAESMLSHIKRFDLIPGRVEESLPAYLAKNPETLISLAYFDLDLYQPTKAALDHIAPRLTKGSIIAFDELGHPNYPGETQAVLQAFDLPEIRLRRFPFHPYPAYVIV